MRPHPLVKSVTTVALPFSVGQVGVIFAWTRAMHNGSQMAIRPLTPCMPKKRTRPSEQHWEKITTMPKKH
jgi:hypothetical protein